MLSAGAVFLCMALLFLLSGCGGRENGADGPAANGPGAEEGIYVPEFIPIEGEYVDYDGARVAGNHLCYLSFSWNEEIQYYGQVINRLSLQERTASSASNAFTAAVLYPLGKPMTVQMGSFPSTYSAARFT